MPPAYIRSRANGEVITDPGRPVWVTHTGVIIRWTNPSQWLDCGRASFGVRGADGSHDLTLEGLRLTNAAHGTHLTGARNVRVLGCQSKECGGEGFRGGGLSDCVIEDCESWDHTSVGWDGEPLGIDPNKSHAYYFESRGLTMRRCIGRDCNGMGLHARGANWRVEDCDFLRNRPGADGKGAGDVQITSAATVLLLRCLLEDGDSGITLFNENGPCRDVTLESCAVWEPDGHFAVDTWAGVVLRVVGGLVVGKWQDAEVAFSGQHFKSESETPAARDALAAWKGKYRGGGLPPEPEPPDGEDLAAENEQLKAQVAALEADAASARALIAEAEVKLAQAEGLLE